MTERMPQHYVAERLREAFATDRRVGELGLEVLLVAGAVHVHGTVGSVERRDAISVVVRELLPGLELRNEVRVLDASDPPHAPEVLS